MNSRLIAKVGSKPTAIAVAPCPLKKTYRYVGHMFGEIVHLQPSRQPLPSPPSWLRPEIEMHPLARLAQGSGICGRGCSHAGGVTYDYQ
jgi:hypothetical protein